MEIRPAQDKDRDPVWEIFQEVVSAGDTFVFHPNLTKAEGLEIWFHPSQHCFVAEEGGRVVGSYILRANQPGLGSHVANASFIVRRECRGKRVGYELGRHALDEARRLGFRAMQFNAVVSTNQNAVNLWKKLGFSILGTVPQGYNHKTLGLVDTCIMHRML